MREILVKKPKGFNGPAGHLLLAGPSNYHSIKLPPCVSWIWGAEQLSTTWELSHQLCYLFSAPSTWNCDLLHLTSDQETTLDNMCIISGHPKHTLPSICDWPSGNQFLEVTFLFLFNRKEEKKSLNITKGTTNTKVLLSNRTSCLLQFNQNRNPRGSG